MHLNIKNHEAHALARQLADATGKSLTEVVTKALRDELERASKAPSMASALMQISSDSAARFKHPYDRIDHGDMLYDDLGLPK
jgi:antitoxin VapB